MTPDRPPGVPPGALLDLQIDALFTHDARGRIVRMNEPDGPRAPSFFFGRSRDGNRWRFRDDLPDALVGQLHDLARDEPVSDDLSGLPGFHVVLSELFGTEAITVHAGPAWYFPDVLPKPGGVVQITPDNLARYRPSPETAPGWSDDWPETLRHRQPCMAAIEDGRMAAICVCARLTDRVAEAGLETFADYRGHGFGPKVTLAWARAIRERGRIPLYSTSWENAASRAVARKLGLVQYATDYSLTVRIAGNVIRA